MDTFFLIYTIIMTAFIGLSVLGKVGMKLLGKYETTPRMVQREELFTIPFLCVGLIGLFGYVESMAIFSQLFWQVYIVLLLLQPVVAFGMPKLKWLKAEIPFNKFVIVNVVGLIATLPMYYMLIVYAFFNYPGVS